MAIYVARSVASIAEEIRARLALVRLRHGLIGPDCYILLMVLWFEHIREVLSWFQVSYWKDSMNISQDKGHILEVASHVFSHRPENRNTPDLKPRATPYALGTYGYLLPPRSSRPASLRQNRFASLIFHYLAKVR
jgi:hypothetical protein